MPIRTRRNLAVLLAVSIAILAAPSVEAAPKRNRCVTPDGIDLNAEIGTKDAILTPFCTTANTGDWLRPTVRWTGASTHEVIPAGYVPSRPTPREDFLAKFSGARYVLDVGTARERTHRVSAEDLIIAVGDLPEDRQFLGIQARLRPVAKGRHTFDVYFTLAADNWDGMGTDPNVNLAPGGETLIDSYTVVVRNGKR